MGREVWGWSCGHSCPGSGNRSHSDSVRRTRIMVVPAPLPGGTGTCRSSCTCLHRTVPVRYLPLGVLYGIVTDSVTRVCAGPLSSWDCRAMSMLARKGTIVRKQRGRSVKRPSGKSPTPAPNLSSLHQASNSSVNEGSWADKVDTRVCISASPSFRDRPETTLCIPASPARSYLSTGTIHVSNTPHYAFNFFEKQKRQSMHRRFKRAQYWVYSSLSNIVPCNIEFHDSLYWVVSCLAPFHFISCLEIWNSFMSLVVKSFQEEFMLIDISWNFRSEMQTAFMLYESNEGN